MAYYLLTIPDKAYEIYPQIMLFLSLLFISVIILILTKNYFRLLFSTFIFIVSMVLYTYFLNPYDIFTYLRITPMILIFVFLMEYLYSQNSVNSLKYALTVILLYVLIIEVFSGLTVNASGIYEFALIYFLFVMAIILLIWKLKSVEENL
ncbi:MAG: hypothetical protein ACP5RZ_00280 [Thermoplasmata archaeon]